MKITKSVTDYFKAMGKQGGLKGGPARALALSQKRRTEIARMGAYARLDKLKQKA